MGPWEQAVEVDGHSKLQEGIAQGLKGLVADELLAGLGRHCLHHQHCLWVPA